MWQKNIFDSANSDKRRTKSVKSTMAKWQINSLLDRRLNFSFVQISASTKWCHNIFASFDSVTRISYPFFCFAFVAFSRRLLIHSLSRIMIIARLTNKSEWICFVRWIEFIIRWKCNFCRHCFGYGETLFLSCFLAFRPSRRECVKCANFTFARFPIHWIRQEQQTSQCAIPQNNFPPCFLISMHLQIFQMSTMIDNTFLGANCTFSRCNKFSFELANFHLSSRNDGAHNDDCRRCQENGVKNKAKNFRFCCCFRNVFVRLAVAEVSSGRSWLKCKQFQWANHWNSSSAFCVCRNDFDNEQLYFNRSLSAFSHRFRLISDVELWRSNNVFESNKKELHIRETNVK